MTSTAAPTDAPMITASGSPVGVGEGVGAKQDRIYR